MELSDSRHMKQADNTAISDRGVPSLRLMETAAVALARAAEDYLGAGGTAAVFCGPGNNGGDGLAAARILLEADRDLDVRVFLVGRREKMTEDSLAMEEKLLATGGMLEIFSADDPTIPRLLERADVIIDAIFGVGLSRDLSGDGLAAVRLMNQSGKPVVAADIPSGVSADTGCILGDGVRAACTVTFSMAKPGHYVEPGCLYTGALRIEDIGIPRDLTAVAGCGVYAIHGEDLRLPVKKPLTHKGDYGRLLIVAGSIPYTGAPTLCAQAAVSSGAGLVFLGVPSDIYEITAVKNLEAMPFPLQANQRGRVSPGAWPALRERLEKCNACVIGPGLGRDEDTQALTEQVVTEAEIPVVADADALWAVSRNLDVLRQAKAPVVLTPHEGEFQRLLGRPVTDRLTDARNFAREYSCAVALKGHRTICAFPDGKAYIIDAGGPGMATGGSGDVLAGVIGAVLGFLPQRRAVVTACWLHARAGDLAAQALGEYAMKAGDIISYLGRAQEEIIG